MSELEAPFPHCDSLVLHDFGKCQYCDHYPDMQKARILDGVNFTGESDPGKLPCPSTIRRPLDIVEKWPGNRAWPKGMLYDEKQ